MEEGEGPAVTDVNYDVAPYKFLVKRITCYPRNPLAAKAQRAKPAITKAVDQCGEQVEGQLCLNEDFISEPEARRLGVTTTCLKCAAFAKYLEVDPKVRAVEWACEHGVLFDVRVDDSTGISYFWYNPDTVERAAELNPSDDILGGLTSFQEELAEYNAELSKCEDDEERQECQDDIKEKMEERRQQRMAVFQAKVNVQNELALETS